MGVRLICFLALVAAAFLLTSRGGGDDLSGIVIDIRPTSTTAAPGAAPPTVPVPAAGSGSTVLGAAATAPAPTGEWTAVTGNLAGLSSECGNVVIASEPTHDLFVVGVAGHGMWSPEPGTSQWNAFGAEGTLVENHVAHLLVDPQHPETIWESGNYGVGGVYRSDDSGQSFRRLGEITHVDSMSVDFTDPERSTLLVGSHERADLYLSRDGGDSWDVITGLPPDIGFTAAPLIIDRDTFMVATNNGGAGAGIFRTTDGGSSWTRVHQGGVWGIPVVRDDAIHWLLEGGGGVVSSTDAGVTWTAKPSNGNVAQLALQLLDMPDGSLATFGQDHIVRSTDGGATWQPIGPALPYTPNHIGYAASEAMFYVSRYDCSFGGENDNDVKDDAILRVAVN